MIRKLLIPILAVLLLVASVSAASLVSLEDVVSTGEVSSYCGAVDPSNIDSCNHDTQTTPRDSSSISIPDSFFDALGNHSRDRKGCLDVNVFTSDPDDVYSSLKASSLAMWYNHRGVDCMGFQQDNDKMLCSYPLFLLNDENELFSVHSLLSDLDDRYSPRSTPYSSGCDDFSFSSTSSAKDFMFNLVDDVDDNHLDGVAEVSSRYLPNRNRTFSSGHRYIDQWSDYSMIIVSEDESSSAIRASYLSSLLNVPFFVKSHDNISMVRSLADDKDVIVVSSTPVFIQRMKRLFGEDLSPSYPSLDTAFLVSGSRLADFEHRILSRLYDDADSGNVSASRDDDYIEGHTQDAIKNDDYIHQVPLDREISSSNKLVVYNSHDLSKGRDVVGKTELTGGSFETTGVNAHDVVSENASLFYGEPLLAPYLGVAHGQRLLDLNTEDFISDTRITTFDSFAAFSSFNEHFSVDDRSFSSEAARSNARIRSKEQDIERPSDSTYFTFLSSPDSFPYSFDSNTSVPSEVYIALEDNSLGVDVDDLLSRPVHAGWLFSPSVSLTSLMTMQNLFFAPPGFEDTRSGYRMNIEYEPTVSHQRNDPYTVGFSSGDPEYANRVAFQDDALKHDDLFSADYIPVTTHIDRDLLYRPDRQADSIDIEGLQFFTAQTDLWPTPSTENALDKLIAFFRSNPGVDVTLIAHADHRRLNPSTDSFENNIELSQARAEAIKDVIESYAKDHPSIDLGTIDTEGRGATEPRVVDTSTYPYLASYDDDGDGSVTLGESFFNTHDLPDTVRRRALSLNRRVELHVDDSPSYDRGASRKTISDNRSYPDPFYNLLYHQVSFSSDDFLSFPFDNEDLDFVSPSYFSSMVVDSPYFGYEHRLDSGEFSFAWLLFKKGVRSVYSFDRGTSPSDNADYFAQTLVTSKRDGLLQGALPHNMFDV
ncbi:MAG: OmpA family protein, partial [Nanoarchaeota archaeon]